jgi:hypothetical protein
MGSGEVSLTLDTRIEHEAGSSFPPMVCGDEVREID